MKATAAQVSLIGSASAVVALVLVGLVAHAVSRPPPAVEDGLKPSYAPPAARLVAPVLVLPNDDGGSHTQTAFAPGEADLPVEIVLSPQRPGPPLTVAPVLPAADKLAAQAEAYARAGKLDAARAAAKEALAEDEMNALAYRVLGDCAFVAHDIDDALFHWERGLHRNSGDAVLQSRVRFGQAERRTLAGMRLLKEEHFIIAHQPAEEAGARATARTLESAREFVGRFYDFYPVDLVPVVLYPRDRFYARGHQASWAVADYDGRIRVGSDTAESQMLLIRQILHHEYAHAVLDRATQGCVVPAWLNEGLAQLIENRLAAPTTVSCRDAHNFPLMKLEDSFGAYASAGMARSAYLTSLHAAEKLVARFGDEGVRRLVKAIAKRCEFTRAFEESLGVTYSDFAKGFDGERL